MIRGSSQGLVQVGRSEPATLRLWYLSMDLSGAISQEALLWKKTGGIQIQGAAPEGPEEGAKGEGVLVKAIGEITDMCTTLYRLHKTVIDK